MKGKIRISKEIFNAITEHCRNEAPVEACGVLAGEVKNEREKVVKKAYPCRNAAKSSFRYRISPEELIDVFNKIEKAGLKLIGFYHSHPFSSSHVELSEVDKKEALWYGASYIIISPQKKKIASWHLNEKGFEEEDVIIEE